MKKEYAEGVLAAMPGERPRTPRALGEVLEPATRAWLADIAAARHPVHGDLDELLPVLGAAGDPHPDDVDEASLAALDAAGVAERLLDAAGWTDPGIRGRARRVAGRLARGRRTPRSGRSDA